MKTASPLRKKKRQRTYLELVKTALQLFREQGYEQTTVEQIAETADYSASTFFRYFGSKEEVAFYGVQSLFQEFGEEIMSLPAAASPWEHISQSMVEACRKLTTLTEELGHNQIELWIKEPTLDRRFRGLSTEWETQISKAYALHTKTHPETDITANLISKAVIAAAHNGFQLHIATGKELSIIVADSLKLLEKGFGEEGST
ncbi:TetR/AcrR family transcriptional regulator [Zhongshania marina]|uniref:TetR/AcrR family transcriptional regulator n=1 Tax=Zhongshania marina TaxID=2304603 RepID=A0ABX9W6V1_9GAMM|nr:TetR/AcrR family transcriptional regulator [Zhongshania marina]